MRKTERLTWWQALRRQQGFQRKKRKRGMGMESFPLSHPLISFHPPKRCGRQECVWASVRFFNRERVQPTTATTTLFTALACLLSSSPNHSKMAFYTTNDSYNAVVADVGSYATKIGFAGEDYPSSYFRSVRDVVVDVVAAL
jgi:hypothetical protein